MLRLSSGINLWRCIVTSSDRPSHGPENTAKSGTSRDLFNAAPDLYAALKIARRYVADLPIMGDADLAIVDAALAKAEGKS